MLTLRNWDNQIRCDNIKPCKAYRVDCIYGYLTYKGTVDVILLELAKTANRPMVETEAFEYKYILSGKVSYNIDNKIYKLSAGDSLLFDGRIPHTPSNMGKRKSVMLVIYFFEEKS